MLKLGISQNFSFKKVSKWPKKPEQCKIRSKKQHFIYLGPPSYDAFLHSLWMSPINLSPMLTDCCSSIAGLGPGQIDLKSEKSYTLAKVLGPGQIDLKSEKSYTLAKVFMVVQKKANQLI